MDYTVEVHANRMPKFLECEEECEEACNRCPADLGFSPSPFCNVFGEKFGPPYNSCKICNNFIGEESLIDCPCNRLGHSEAIAAAHAALELWDAGEHPMQEEGNE